MAGRLRAWDGVVGGRTLLAKSVGSLCEMRYSLEMAERLGRMWKLLVMIAAGLGTLSFFAPFLECECGDARLPASPFRILVGGFRARRKILVQLQRGHAPVAIDMPTGEQGAAMPTATLRVRPTRSDGGERS
jgi:hypothetical protein